MEGLSVERILMSADACWDILETACDAGSHGIGYWAKPLKLERRSENDMVLVLKDLEADKPTMHTISASEIRTAVLTILRNPQGTGWAERILGQDHPDGPMADAIVQVACFGKVVYG